MEGTSGAGKSTLIDALIRRHVAGVQPRKIRSLVHLAQSHTYGPLAVSEDRRLTIGDNTRHLDRIVSSIEWLHASVQEHDKPWCFVVIDILHLTHCVRPNVVKWSDVELFDRRLAERGCKLLFLEVEPPTIWQRGITPRMNDQFILEYARKFGRTNEEIHAYIVEEQQMLKSLFGRSSMPKLLLKNEAAHEAALDAAYRFWSEN